MAKDLKTRVILETKTAEKRLEALAKAINKVDKAVNKAAKETANSDKALQKSVKTAERISNSTERMRQKHAQVNRQIKRNNKDLERQEKIADGILSAFGRILGALGAGQVIKIGIDTSDAITSAENKLNAINARAMGDGAFDANGKYTSAVASQTQEQMDKMYAAAQRARMGYTDMMANVSKSMTLAPKAFKDNLDNAIAFQEIMGKSYVVGGASAAEARTSMYQMIQALGSGILQGDELRSVREGAPLAYQAIEKFAQGVYGAEENLKDLASKGKITSDIVVAAMMNAGDEINKTFEASAMTFGQAWQMIKNTATMAFKPVLQRMNEILNSEGAQTLINDIAGALQFLAGIAMVVVNIVGFFIQQWEWLRYILIPLSIIIMIVAGALLFFAAKAKIAAIWAAISGMTAFTAWLAATWPILLIIALIVIVILVLNKLGVSFADICGFIVGVVLAVVSIVWNTVIGVINAIIQFLWTKFVEPWIGIIEWVLNVFNGGFDSFGDAVKNLLGNIISWFLSLGKVVTKIIDAIFGTNWTAGLSSLQDSVLSWGKNESAITLSREAPTVQSMSGGKIDRWSTKDAYSTGFNWASNGIGSLGSGGLPDINSDEYALSTNSYDPSTLGDIAKADDKTAKNTGKMADTMKLTEEELEYLKDIAEMEWKKEYTTANVKVDMSNYNNISGEADLDGIVTKLVDTVYEELNAVANGVYAG